jgi:uncharacterized membrane protein
MRTLVVVRRLFVAGVILEMMDVGKSMSENTRGQMDSITKSVNQRGKVKMELVFLSVVGSVVFLVSIARDFWFGYIA